MKSLISVLVTLLILFALNVSGANEKTNQPGPLSGMKIIAVWSVEAREQEKIDSVVGQAQSLGFNAVCWNRPEVAEACHKQSMKAFAIVCPLDRRLEAQPQVLAPAEQDLPGFQADNILPGQFYQYGGEPVRGNLEILDQNFTCPNDPSVVGYTLKQISAAVASGYDGIIFDFVGYRNYRSCQCELCSERFAEFRKDYSERPDTDAANLYYENLLVELYDTLYLEIKTLAPDLIVANHIHPVFLPNTFYGLRVNSDYCGITVSWFFQPHWPLEKVEDYTQKVVRGPYLHKQVEGLPMIGFYSDGRYDRDRKSGNRLRQELEILKKMGAQHLLLCELGHILRDREASEAVRQALTGN